MSRTPILLATLAIIVAGCEREGVVGDPWRVVATRDISESTATIITFENGRALRVPLRDVTVHDALRGAGAVPWLLISGWSCSECDVEEQVFAVRADTSLGKRWIPTYSYPGPQMEPGEDSAFFRSRLFVGICLAEFPRLALWLQEQRDSSAKWHKSIHMLIPRGQLVDSQLPGNAQLEARISQRAGKPGCREIPGKRQDIY